MRWQHFEADKICDEFWSSEIRIYKDWYVEVHVGRDRKTKKYDFQIFGQHDREVVVRTGFDTRAAAEVGLRMTLVTLLKTAAYRIERRIK